MKKIIIKNVLAENVLQRERQNAMEIDQGGEFEQFNNSSIPMDFPGLEPASVKEYPFVTGEIPRFSANSPEVDKHIQEGKPVVITGSGLVDSARKWNLEYLRENMGDGLNFVFESNSRKFKYFDDKRVAAWPGFERPTSRHEVTFQNFIDMLEDRKNSSNCLYFQQTLNDTVGKSIVQDFVRFRWDWCTKYQRLCHWGTLSSNLLLIAMEGNVTPCHYDEQENFFAQIQGYKRCLLFAPDQFECMYPYPVSHPCDRQSQVDLDNPDHNKYPKFKNARSVEAIVGPGDVLYIPMYWWHNIESLRTKEPSHPPFGVCSVPVTVSVNFWYKASPVQSKVQRPISSQQKVAVMRNIEKMLGEVLGDPKEVGSLLRMVVEGRYDVVMTDGQNTET